MPRKKAGRGRKRASSSESESESEYAESSSSGDDDDVDEDYAEEEVNNDGDKEAEEREADVVESLPQRKKVKRSAPRPAALASSALASPTRFSRAGQPQTERGGYRHKESSKIKISVSNKGKTPWNKQKRRSGTDKAKISAGVRARNRSKLLEQLEKWDMSEDEYEKVKRDIKLVREKLRRKKLENEGKASKSKRTAASEHEESDNDEEDADQEVTQSDGDVDPKEEEEREAHAVDARVEGPEYTWEPHPFDSVDPAIYSQFCPNNGPGGLVCCEICTANYSQYLSFTFKSMQQQKTSLIGRDVHDLASSLQCAAARLEKTLAEIKTEKSTTKRSKSR